MVTVRSCHARPVRAWLVAAVTGGAGPDAMFTYQPAAMIAVSLPAAAASG